MLHTLLYVSYSTLYMPDDGAVVLDVVRQSRRRNAALGLTGALVFTHQRFAQYLEGPEAGIADLMASLRRDSRHRDILLVESGSTKRRRFPGWDMAYSGTSDLVAAQVDALAARELEDPQSLCPDRMIGMMAFLGSLKDMRKAA